MSTSPSSCSTVPGCWGCSRAVRFWWAPPRARTWWPPSGPRNSRGRSTGRCNGWPGSTTTSRCGPPTGRARSARRRPGPSGPRRSASNAPPTPCFAPRTRTCSSSNCWPPWGAFRPISCGSARSTAAAPPSSRVTRCAPSRSPRSHACGRRVPRWWTCGRSPTSPPAMSPGRCPSHCGRYSRPGWAGSSHPTCRW